MRGPVCSGISGNEANNTACQSSCNIGTCGQVVSCPEQHGVFESKGRQGRVAAAESGGEGKPQVGRFDEPGGSQSAEEPHEQAATEIDEKSVPGHICAGNSPAGTDVVAGQITQNAARKATAADTEKGF